MQVILEVTEGPKASTRFIFDSRCVVLMGRSHRCGKYCLGDDDRMSRVHMVVEVDPPTCHLRDLGSENHTFVNGARVVEAEVGDGDVIALGRTRLLVRVAQSTEEEVAEGEDQFAVWYDAPEAAGEAEFPSEPSPGRRGT